MDICIRLLHLTPTSSWYVVSPTESASRLCWRGEFGTGASASFPLSVSCSHSKRDSGHKHGMSPRAHSRLPSLRDFAAHHLYVTCSSG